MVDHDGVEAYVAGELRYFQHLLTGLADVADNAGPDEEHGQVPDRGKGILDAVSPEALVEELQGVVMDRLQAEGDMPESRPGHLGRDLGVQAEIDAGLDAVGLADAALDQQVAGVSRALPGIEEIERPEDTPLRVAVPAFVLSELKARGLTAPVLAVGDGALGFWAALRDVFPDAVRISARVSANRRDRLTAWLPMLSPPHREGGVGAVRVEVRGDGVDGGRRTLIAGVAELVGNEAAPWSGSVVPS